MTPPLVGFITPPDWYDPSPVEFHALMNGQVRVQQCILNLPGFEYRIESIACSESEQIGAARLLAGAGCDLIASVGTPFAWAGLGSVEAARERCGRLTQASGVSNIMTGIAIVDALRHLGIERVGLACTYYSDAWKTQWGDYIRASGFEVAAHNFAACTIELKR